tara:strand:+ start:697 stop:1143 length:447 start_codon:yes stop_codon:yes gene_type:complete
MAIPQDTQIYGNQPSVQTAKQVSTKDPSIRGFVYPLEKNPGNGYFSKSTGLKLVKSMVKSFIRTNRGERFMLPDYGADLQKYLMEPLDENTFMLLKDEISKSVRRYLGGLLSSNKLQVFETSTGNLLVKLFVQLRDLQSSNFNVEVRI